MALGKCASGSSYTAAPVFPLPHFLQGTHFHLVSLGPLLYYLPLKDPTSLVTPRLPWSFPLPEVGKREVQMLGDQDLAIHRAQGWSGHGLGMVRWVRSGSQAMLTLGILQSPGGPPAAGRRGECVFESGTGHEPSGDTHPYP